MRRIGNAYTLAKDDSPLDLYCSPSAGIRLQVTGPYFYLTETHPGAELLFTNNESHRNFLAQNYPLAHRDMSRDRALQLLSRTKPDCKLWQILRAHCLLLARNYYRRNNYRQTAGYPKRESTTPPKPARRL